MEMEKKIFFYFLVLAQLYSKVTFTIKLIFKRISRILFALSRLFKFMKLLVVFPIYTINLHRLKQCEYGYY